MLATNLTRKEQAQLDLSTARGMLVYWQNKPADFWMNWKGLSKEEILSGWQKQVNYYQDRLNKINSLYARFERKG